jgi:CBS domain-containing protein
MLVADIMTKKVITVGPEQTLLEVSKIFYENDISGAPVVDPEGTILGIITESDVLKALKPFERKLQMVLTTPTLVGIAFRPEYREKELSRAISEIQKVKVAEVMTTEVFILEPTDTVQQAVMAMNTRHVNRFPVVEKGKVVGMLARGDLIRYLGSLDPKCLP